MTREDVDNGDKGFTQYHCAVQFIESHTERNI